MRVKCLKEAALPAPTGWLWVLKCLSAAGACVLCRSKLWPHHPTSAWTQKPFWITNHHLQIHLERNSSQQKSHSDFKISVHCTAQAQGETATGTEVKVEGGWRKANINRSKHRNTGMHISFKRQPKQQPRAWLNLGGWSGCLIFVYMFPFLFSFVPERQAPREGI